MRLTKIKNGEKHDTNAIDKFNFKRAIYFTTNDIYFDEGLDYLIKV